MSYGRRVWYLWGPVIIKSLIGGMLIWMVSAAFVTLYAVKETGGDMDALMALSEDQEAVEEMKITVSEQIMELEVPIGIASSALILPVLAGFLYFDRKKGKPTALVRQKALLWQYAAILIIAVSMCIGLNNLITLSNLSSLSESYEAVTEAFYTPPFLLQIIYLGILSPICEELAFRGLMFRRMRTQTPFLAAALYSSFAFAVIHGNLVQIPYAFIMGMMFAYVYEKYGSLKAPCLAHMAANITAVAATKYRFLDIIFEEPVRAGIITVVCAACASTMFVLIQRIEAGSFDPIIENADEHKTDLTV